MSCYVECFDDRFPTSAILFWTSSIQHRVRCLYRSTCDTENQRQFTEREREWVNPSRALSVIRKEGNKKKRMRFTATIMISGIANAGCTGTGIVSMRISEPS